MAEAEAPELTIEPGQGLQKTTGITPILANIHELHQSFCAEARLVQRGAPSEQGDPLQGGNPQGQAMEGGSPVASPGSVLTPGAEFPSTPASTRAVPEEEQRGTTSSVEGWAKPGPASAQPAMSPAAEAGPSSASATPSVRRRFPKSLSEAVLPGPGETRGAAKNRAAWKAGSPASAAGLVSPVLPGDGKPVGPGRRAVGQFPRSRSVGSDEGEGEEEGVLQSTQEGGGLEGEALKKEMFYRLKERTMHLQATPGSRVSIGMHANAATPRRRTGATSPGIAEEQPPSSAVSTFASIPSSSSSSSSSKTNPSLLLLPDRADGVPGGTGARDGGPPRALSPFESMAAQFPKSVSASGDGKMWQNKQEQQRKAEVDARLVGLQKKFRNLQVVHVDSDVPASPSIPSSFAKLTLFPTTPREGPRSKSAMFPGSASVDAGFPEPRKGRMNAGPVTPEHTQMASSGGRPHPTSSGLLPRAKTHSGKTGGEPETPSAGTPRRRRLQGGSAFPRSETHPAAVHLEEEDLDECTVTAAPEAGVRPLFRRHTEPNPAAPESHLLCMRPWGHPPLSPGEIFEIPEDPLVKQKVGSLQLSDDETDSEGTEGTAGLLGKQHANEEGEEEARGTRRKKPVTPKNPLVSARSLPLPSRRGRNNGSRLAAIPRAGLRGWMAAGLGFGMSQDEGNVGGGLHDSTRKQHGTAAAASRGLGAKGVKGEPVEDVGTFVPKHPLVSVSSLPAPSRTRASGRGGSTKKRGEFVPKSSVPSVPGSSRSAKSQRGPSLRTPRSGSTVLADGGGAPSGKPQGHSQHDLRGKAGNKVNGSSLAGTPKHGPRRQISSNRKGWNVEPGEPKRHGLEGGSSLSSQGEGQRPNLVEVGPRDVPKESIRKSLDFTADRAKGKGTQLTRLSEEGHLSSLAEGAADVEDGMEELKCNHPPGNIRRMRKATSEPPKRKSSGGLGFLRSIFSPALGRSHTSS